MNDDLAAARWTPERKVLVNIGDVFTLKENTWFWCGDKYILCTQGTIVVCIEIEAHSDTLVNLTFLHPTLGLIKRHALLENDPYVLANLLGLPARPDVVVALTQRDLRELMLKSV